MFLHVSLSATFKGMKQPINFVYYGSNNKTEIFMEKHLLLFIFSLIFFSERTFSQDSTTSAKTPLRYHSVGFQVSFVSGIGIAYGINEENSYRALFSGGLLTDNDKTYFSFGIDYQKELTKNQNFRVFIGPSAGTRGVTYEKPSLRIAWEPD